MMRWRVTMKVVSRRVVKVRAATSEGAVTEAKHEVVRLLPYRLGPDDRLEPEVVERVEE